MNTPFELMHVGAAGIGLVWGWWCVLRFRNAVHIRFSGWIALLFTAASGAAIGWMSDKPSGWIFLACAGISAFFHYWWLHYLRKRYT